MRDPYKISEERIKLSEEYSRYCGELANLVRVQASFFNTNRENHNSDKATERAFDTTDEGIKMTIVKLKLKAIEKTMSAYNTHLRLLENQAKNLY